MPLEEKFLILALERNLRHSGGEKHKSFLGGSPFSSENGGRSKEKRELGKRFQENKGYETIITHSLSMLVLGKTLTLCVFHFWLI